MNPEIWLFAIGFLTFLNIGVMTFVSIVSGTIVYSWIRNMQVAKDALPKMLQDAVNEMASEYVEPMRERFDEYGKARQAPNADQKDEILLEDDYKNWKAMS